MINKLLERMLKEEVNNVLKIHISPWAAAGFWDEHDGYGEFWAFKSEPKCKPGDKIEFYIGGKLIAEAEVHTIEEPGESACGHSGRFGSKWKVHWLNKTFKDLRK